jgi:two-component system sensor histidine kinase AtoS
MAAAHAYTDAPPMPPAPADPHAEIAALVHKRIRFGGHVVVWFMVTLMFAAMTGSVEATAFIGLSWGTWLAYKGYHSVLAPLLERQWMEDELRWRATRAATLESERAARETRQTRSLEELSASIAHEIRNPITAAKSLVQQMGEDPTARENVEYAKIALDELARVERSIAHLLRYARDEAFEATDVSLVEVTDSALEAVKDRLERQAVQVQRDHDGPARLRGDAEKLRRVVLNLITNALDALEEGPTPSPRLTLSSGTNLAGTEVWLKIRDNGPGIPPELQSEIFKPFHTSKAHGTGLGLAITQKLVDAHRGQLELASEPGLYAELTVTLPVNKSALTSSAGA